MRAMPLVRPSKLRRLASMSRDEIVSRLRQEIAKKVDTHRLFQPRRTSLPAIEALNTGRFFFDADEIPQRISLIRENVTGFDANVLAQAEQILKHQFPLLGYGSLDYGNDIDWQLDIVSGKRAHLKPWPNINYLDFDEVGDCKVTWELNRHQFLVTLAKAWLLTGDNRFVQKLADIYYDWHNKNPYPLGVNWASSLEVAFRSLSWIWVRELLAGCEIASKLRNDITLALGFNAWYIRRYLSTYFSPNTHLQGEAVALFFIGSLCPSLPNASSWREQGWNILLEHALTKVLKDGAYFEQSTYYHVYALDFFLHARILAARNGMPIPDSFDAVLKRMLKYLSHLCQAGSPPRFGDDDGGRLFDGSRNRAEHLLDPLATGVAFFELDVCKQSGVCPTEEMLWLLGAKGLQILSGHAERKSGSSASFPQTGLYVFHADQGARSQAVLDAGPLGGGSGGHGHADALSLTLNVNGTPLLVDPGTCNYVGPDSDREDFRLTRAHNTIIVDGLSQAEPRSAFSWFRWPEVKIELSAITPTFDIVVTSHDGYTRLPSPVTHRRTLFASHEQFWFVLDELIAEGPHDYALHWHLAPDVYVASQTANGWMVEQDGSKLHILTIAPEWLRTVEAGWFSAAYGMKQAAPVLRLAKRSDRNEDVATVLWAGTGGSPLPAMTALAGAPGIRGYDLNNGDGHWIFLIGDGVSNMDIAGWESDAKILCAKLDGNGLPQRVILIQSTFVRFRRETLHSSTERLPYHVWERESRP